MTTIALEQPLPDLARLVEQAQRGEEFVFTRANLPTAKLVPASPDASEGRPQFGCLAGKIAMAPDFDAPLDDFREYME